LIDDRAGNTSQALGVAEALGLPFQEIQIAYTGAVKLPNVLRGASLVGIADETRIALLQKAPHWPSLVIAAGRRTSSVARWVKRQAMMARQQCAICQIMDPGGPGRPEFDLIVVPKHDRKVPRGENVLVVAASPHRVTAERLQAEKAAWHDRLGGLASPRLAVLVGGKTKAHDFGVDRAVELGRGVRALAEELGGQVMVTTSRRTGPDAVSALFAQLPQDAWTYAWGAEGENPYFGFLAWADVLIVTGDTMSMASEACGTDKPVVIESPKGHVSHKHSRLHDGLVSQGRAIKLSADASEMIKAMGALNCTPINSAYDVVEALRKRDLLPS